MQEYEIFFWNCETGCNDNEIWEFGTESEMWNYVKKITKEENYTHAEVNKIHYLGTLEK